MATKGKSTRAAKAQSHPELFEELDDIQEELLALVHHVQLADQRLWGDLQGVPEEYQPAAVVLHRAAVALDELHNRLDRLNVSIADLRHGPGWRKRVRAGMPA